MGMSTSLRRLVRIVALVARASLVAACGAPAPLAGSEGTAALADDPATQLEVTLEPPSPLDAAPPVVRIHIKMMDLPGDRPRLESDRFVLIAGQIGPAHLGQLARDEISFALSERIIPTLEWTEADDTVVVAPTERLSAGEVYSIASGVPKFSQEIVVMDDDPLARLELVWPPGGASSQGSERRVAVWCGDSSLPTVTQPVALAPTDEPATLNRGTTAQGRGHRCVHLEPAGRPSNHDALPPPVLIASDGEPLGRIEPIALRVDGPASPLAPLTCQPDEIAIGPGCGRVADDRVYFRSPAMPLLWTVSSPQGPPMFAAVVATEPEEHGLLSPFPPASTVILLVDVMDRAGRLESTVHPLTTLASMPHVVVNEVLANPIGEEPEQEWVELYNDGLATAQLGGYVLADIGGEVVLPGASLPPGAFALIVNEGFDAESDYDPPPPNGTLLIRVPKLGKGGLNNQGEPLKLRDQNGNLISRFSATPKPKPGVSVIRVAPKAPDGNESSFMRCPELPTPGQHNLGDLE
jgi:hypothetical protein